LYLNIKQKGLEFEIDFPFSDAKVQLFWETSKGFSTKICLEVREVKKLSL
jgi:hypothetical protein